VSPCHIVVVPRVGDGAGRKLDTQLGWDCDSSTACALTTRIGIKLGLVAAPQKSEVVRALNVNNCSQILYYSQLFFFETKHQKQFKTLWPID
jgi:hypothetical protein